VRAFSFLATAADLCILASSSERLEQLLRANFEEPLQPAEGHPWLNRHLLDAAFCHTALDSQLLCEDNSQTPFLAVNHREKTDDSRRVRSGRVGIPAGTGHGFRSALARRRPPLGRPGFGHRRRLLWERPLWQRLYGSSPYYGSSYYSGYSYPNQYTSMYFSGDMNTARAENRVMLNIQAPAGATLWISDVFVGQGDSNRQFISPPLENGRKYVCDVKARWMQDGREMTSTGTLEFQGGQTNLSFDLFQGAQPVSK
jgi:uncharacterized protein (TIGR03000 family)